MTITIVSARYANSKNTSAVVDTVESALVALSEVDTPDEWAALHSSGVVIAPYREPVPSVVSAFQAKAALMQHKNPGLYEQAEAAAAAAGGLTLLAWQEAGEFQRQSPAIAALAAAVGLTDNQVDELFIAASRITA